jgi:hypothetical protein
MNAIMIATIWLHKINMGDYSASTQSRFDSWRVIVIKGLELAAFVQC